MDTAVIAPGKKWDLEARGFGWLIEPAPARDPMQVAAPGTPFSYFTYELPIPAPSLIDKTWACTPIDGVWGFIRASGVAAAGPCLLHLCEDAEARPVRPSTDLARHWCPVLFDDQPLSE